MKFNAMYKISFVFLEIENVVNDAVAKNHENDVLKVKGGR